MKRIIDDWGLRYPGVKKVEHVYFYRVAVADEGTRRQYLAQAYTLGERFADDIAVARPDAIQASAPAGTSR